MLISAVQCGLIDIIFSFFSNTTFFDSPVGLYSDTDAIRSSPIYHCIVTALLVRSTVYLHNMDIYMDGAKIKEKHIIVCTNFLKFKERRFYYLPEAHINSRAQILIVEPLFGDSRVWVQMFFDKFHAVDVTVAVLEAGGHFFTWFPYQEGDCGHTFSLARLKPPLLFPSKSLKNLHRCPISAFPVIMAPFVIDQERGFEYNILATISQKLNATLKLWRAWDAQYGYHGEVSLDYLLLARKVDVFFGGRDAIHPDFYGNSPTIPHSIEPPVVICPTPKPINRTVLLLYALSKEVWGCVIATFVAILSATYILQMRDNGLRAWALMLGIPYPYGITNFDWTNAFFSCCSFLTLSIAVIYQAALFQILQTEPRERRFRFYDELYNSDLFFLHRGQAFPHLFPRPDRIIPTLYMPLEELGSNSSVYSHIPKSSYLYQSSNSSWFRDANGYPKHYIFDEPPTLGPMSFIMPLGHVLLEEFNGIILQLLDAGLPNWWKTQLYKLQVVNNKFTHPISLLHVQGAFYILLFVHSVALGTFIIEIGISKYQERGTICLRRATHIHFLMK